MAQRVDIATLPEKEALTLVRDHYRVGEVRAQWILGLMRGDHDGDVVSSEAGRDEDGLSANPFSEMDLAGWNPEMHPRWPKGTPKKAGKFMPKGGLPAKFYTSTGKTLAHTGTPSPKIMGKRHNFVVGTKQGEPTMVHAPHISIPKLREAATNEGSLISPDAPIATGTWYPKTKTLKLEGDTKPYMKELAATYPDAEHVTNGGEDITTSFDNDVIAAGKLSPEKEWQLGFINEKEYEELTGKKPGGSGSEEKKPGSEKEEQLGLVNVLGEIAKKKDSEEEKPDLDRYEVFLPSSGKAAFVSKGGNTVLVQHSAFGAGLSDEDKAFLKKKFPGASSFASLASPKKKVPLPTEDPPEMVAKVGGVDLFDKPPEGVKKYTGFVMDKGGSHDGVFFDADKHLSSTAYEIKNADGSKTDISNPGAYGSYNSKTKTVMIKSDSPEPTAQEKAALKKHFPEAVGYKKGDIAALVGQGALKSLDTKAKASSDAPKPKKAPEPETKKAPEAKKGTPYGGYATASDLVGTAGDNKVYSKPIDPDELGLLKKESVVYHHAGTSVTGYHAVMDAAGFGIPLWQVQDLPGAPEGGHWHKGMFNAEKNNLDINTTSSKPTKGMLEKLGQDYPGADAYWNFSKVAGSGVDKSSQGLVKPTGSASTEKVGGHWDSISAANKFFRKVYKPWQKSFDYSESSAIKSYTGGGFATLNHELRKHDGDLSMLSPELRSKQKAIDSAMDKAPELPTEAITYRGRLPDGILKAFEVGVEDGLVGKTFGDPANVSTSIDRGVAKNFSGTSKSTKWKNSMGLLKMPIGTKASYVKGVSSHSEEDEIILRRGTRFRVTKAYREKSSYYPNEVWWIEGDVVPDA